jgi:RNase P subunit RPR2
MHPRKYIHPSDRFKPIPVAARYHARQKNGAARVRCPHCGKVHRVPMAADWDVSESFECSQHAGRHLVAVRPPESQSA